MSIFGIYPQVSSVRLCVGGIPSSLGCDLQIEGRKDLNEILFQRRTIQNGIVQTLKKDVWLLLNVQGCFLAALFLVLKSLFLEGCNCNWGSCREMIEGNRGWNNNLRKQSFSKLLKLSLDENHFNLKKSINDQIDDHYNKCQKLSEIRHVNHTWNLSTQLAG